MESNQKPPINLFADAEEEEKDKQEEEQKKEAFTEKPAADSFIYDDLYYYEEEKGGYLEEYWKRLKEDCVEAIESNSWASFIEEYASAYYTMTQEEKRITRTVMNQGY